MLKFGKWLKFLIVKISFTFFDTISESSQLTFTYSKLTMGTPLECVEYVES